MPMDGVICVEQEFPEQIQQEEQSARDYMIELNANRLIREALQKCGVDISPLLVDEDD